MKTAFSKRLGNQSINLTQQITDKARALNASDMIYLSLGIPYEQMNERLADASMQALLAHKTAYTATAGLGELREVIAQSRDRFTDKENVLVTAGASEALFVVFASLVNPGDEVIIIAPSYFVYERNAQFCGGKPIFVPLAVKEGAFVLDMAKLEQSITGRTKLIVLNSPHNPTGWVADKSTVKALADIVERHSLILLSDEVYKDFVYEDEFVSPEKLSERAIIIDGISKSFSATGLRLGWVIADSEIIRKMLPLHQLILFSAPTPFQYAACEALKKNNRKILARTVSAYRARRDQVCKLLGEIDGLAITKPQGAFYVFPKLRERADSGAFANELLEKQHVVVVPGADYGAGWNNFIRIAYAQNKAALGQACRRIQAFMDSHL